MPQDDNTPSQDHDVSALSSETVARARADPAIDWQKAQRGARLLLEAAGEDPEEDTLSDTWQRRVPATLETLTAGTRDAEKPAMRTFQTESDDLVIKTGIPVYSLCHHHLLPYHGTAYVAYLPDGAVVGLSKLARYVRWQSRRLTMQEELTADVADGLAAELEATGVVVQIEATHLCEAMRGVELLSTTTTRTTVGDLDDTHLNRFDDAINRTQS